MEKLNDKILNILGDDSRYSAEKIAIMLGIDLTEVKKAIEEMEKSGIIVKYCTILNKEKIAKNYVEALIEVKVTPQKRHGFDSIAQEIYSFPEVKSLYLMSGGFDLAVFIEGESLKEVAMFVSEKLSMIENIVSTATHFILKKYKTEGVVTEIIEEIKRIPFQP